MKTHDFKFDFGQKVYTVTRSSGFIDVPCSLCDGCMFLKVKDREIKRPDCFGRGKKHVPTPIKYIASPSPLTIGQMEVVITDSPGRPGETVFDNYMPKKETHEQYMMIESGVGAGQLYDVSLLSATISEAESMAQKMNEEQPR